MMVSNTHILPTQGWRASVIAIGLRVAATLMMVGLSSLSSAFGQSDYSAFWVDDSNPEAVAIVGAGVTENDYSADAIGVETTLTSPNGRTVTGSADDYAAVRVEITLPWDWEDLGDYFVQTRHQPLCWGNWDGSLLYERRSGGSTSWYFNPNYYRCLESRRTTVGVEVGASTVVFRNTWNRDSSNRCIMTLIEPCNVICTGRGQTNETNCPNYVIYIEPWYRWSGGHVCLAFFSSWLEKKILSDTPQPCRE